MSPLGARLALAISRFGIAARGLIFCLAAAAFYRASMRHNPAEAGGTADSLDQIARLGRWPLLFTALGLIAYGGYELINARYRRIRIH